MRVSGTALVFVTLVLALYALYVRGTVASLTTTQQRRPVFTDTAQMLARAQRLRATAAASATAASATAASATATSATAASTVPSEPVDDMAAYAAAARRVGVTGFQMDFGDLGVVRVHIRPEWSSTSCEYAKGVAAARTDKSTVYRLEPGFLIQGSLVAPGVPPNPQNPRAPKVMERGEIGWAGGSKGPDYFIYVGTGPAGWLGVPHDGTFWAEVADEASMLVVRNVSLLEVPEPPPGQMHMLKRKRSVRVTPWEPPPGWPLHERLLKVMGASIDREAEACGPRCHALPRTELHGDVVAWGANHKVRSAAACCAACDKHRAEAKAAGKRPCNVWVWCGSALCAKQQHECWLKHSAKGVWEAKDLLVGVSDRWTAGTEVAAPPEHPSGAGLTLPRLEGECHLALVFASGSGSGPGGAAGLGRVRLRLRVGGTPRAAGRLRAMLEKQGGAVAAAAAAAPCADCALSRVAPEPDGWGSEAVADGLGEGERWPAGAARLELSLGPGLGAAAPGAVPVEPSPTQISRGAVVWAGGGAATGDGPEFFIALAAMPHLGVSYTVWGHIMEEDLTRLSSFAKGYGARAAHLPFALERLSATL